MEKILVTLGGIGLVAFIYWFFFGKKEEVIEVENNVDIVVDGGYSPNTIKVKKGVATQITFLRKDANSCLEEVYIPDFNVREYLPLNKKVKVEIKPEKEGKFVFHCSMNMYKGKIIVS